MSLLTPVYVAGQLKGIVRWILTKTICGISFTLMTALSLAFSQCHANRYRFGARHYHHQSEDNLFQYVSYVHDLPGGIVSRYPLIFFTLSRLRGKAFVLDFDGVNFAEYGADALPLIQNVSRENISDAMTGLYNRKI